MTRTPQGPIAILGWGSLLWDKREPFDSRHGDWHCDGPLLLLEFSRVSWYSRCGALTLVIDPDNGSQVKTYYCESTQSELDNAIADLEEREGKGSSIGYIGHATKNNNSHDKETLNTISKWAASKSFDQVVWTDLKSNFSKKVGKPFSVEVAIDHLQRLSSCGQHMAAEYVFKAPPNVETDLRKALCKQDWFVKLKPTDIETPNCG